MANLATDEMTVTLNGVTIATYPISGGRHAVPDHERHPHRARPRERGAHGLARRSASRSTPPNGYDEYVYDDVHISDSGEYVHAAPWSVGDQGVINVSHGCINLSAAERSVVLQLQPGR